jgi:HAMP domain-containing protein
MAICVVLALLARGHATANVDRSFESSTLLLDGAVTLGKAANSVIAKPRAGVSEEWTTARDAIGEVISGLSPRDSERKICLDNVKSAVDTADSIVNSVTSGSLNSAEAMPEMAEQLKTLTMESARYARISHEAAATLQRDLDYIMGPIFGVLALIMAGGLLVSGRHVFERFTALRHAIGQTAGGNYDHELTVHGDAEIDSLATAFNNMLKQLRQGSEP